ncbi:MAG: adenylate/guanylate cyclase domain-containing protein, partial [Burkholderiales bacterium]|nr:adenylate/guanylate cyclase domain-containing protein [Burkholderiales bacterium]
MTLPPSLRRILGQTRLITGLVMLSYVLCHFTNHALGLVSVAAMNAMLRVNTSFWMGPVGRPLLYSALGIHFCMALHALFRRRSLRMSPPELAQLMLGLSLPFLAAQHVSNTRIGNWAFGANLDFSWELYSYWTVSKLGGLVQEILMLSVWTHAMIGLHFRLKLKPWFARVRFPLFALAILWPTLAMLGYIEGGREVGHLAQMPGWLDMVRAARQVPSQAQQQWLFAVRDGIWIGVACLIGTVLLARWLRWRANMRRGVVQLTYPGNRVVNIPLSTSVLEASRMTGIPHASICGGRGRCST